MTINSDLDAPVDMSTQLSPDEVRMFTRIFANMPYSADSALFSGRTPRTVSEVARWLNRYRDVVSDAAHRATDVKAERDALVQARDVVRAFLGVK